MPTAIQKYFLKVFCLEGVTINYHLSIIIIIIIVTSKVLK